MNKYLTLLLILVAVFSSIKAQSDESKIDFDLGADLMSRYVWRGVDYGRSPSIQPGMALTTGKFEVGAWGAFTTNGLNIQETDLYVSYSLTESLSLTVTDYFFPDDLLDNNNYFDYSKNATGHLFEAMLSYALPYELSVTAATVFYGADKVNAYPGNDATNNAQNFSTYFELAYSTKVKTTDLNAYMGLTTHTGLYGEGFNVVNIGITASKSIELTEKFALPVSCSLITNPQQQNIFLVFGITI